MKIQNLTINKIYSNDELMQIFSCSGQGGIRVSNNNKTITLTSNLTKRSDSNPYKDVKMNSKGEVIYTGMGTEGDQSLTGQNRTLANSQTNGYRLFYFEQYKSNEYTFKGEVVLVDSPYFDNEPEINSNI